MKKKKRGDSEEKESAKSRKNDDWLTRKIFEDLEKGFKIRVTESARPKR